MKLGKAEIVRRSLFLLFLLATVSALGQRANFDVNFGQVRDQFGALAPVTGTAFDFNGEVLVIKPSAKSGGPGIVAGGEMRLPIDADHAKEFAVYGGVVFGSHNFSVGIDGQLRKIYMPTAIVDNQVLNRDNMSLFELPVVIKYKFGPGKRAFIQVQGQPEFTPHFRKSSLSKVPLPNPTLDHGYDIRGSVGYNFSPHYYVQGTYDTRYFKFNENVGNPSNLYNWKSNLVTGGVGVRF